MKMEFSGEVIAYKTFVDKNSSPEPHTAVIKLKIPEGVDFNFEAGQFVMLSKEDFKLRSNPNQLKWTSYSLCSPPSEKSFFEFAIRFLDTPGFTNHLKKTCKVGCTINVKGPYGKFTMIENPHRLIFICTGTGIAPLLCHIRTLLGDGVNIPITLYFGIKNPDVYIFKEELEIMQSDFSNFKVETTITDAGRTDWNGRVGVFNDFLPNINFEGKDETDIYICGNPKMVESMKKLLPEMGFKGEKVHIEMW